MLSIVIEKLLNPSSQNMIPGESIYSDKKMDSFNNIVRGIVTLDTTGKVFSSTTVKLYDAQGNYINSSNVDDQGRYSFQNLAPGEYTTSSYSNKD